MLLFLSIFIVVYGLMHFYAFRKAWKAFPQSRVLMGSLILAGIALTIAPILVRILERNDWHRLASVTAWSVYTWMGYLVVFFCIALIFDFGRGIATLLKMQWKLNHVMTFRIVAIVTLAMVCYGFYEAQDIQIERITIKTPKLKSGSVTIAQISDLHLGVMIKDRYLRRVMTEVKALKPDLIVATGDIVDGQGDELNSLSQYFHTYKPPHGTYAITGNHEYIVGIDHSLRFLLNAGFTMLRADSVRTGGIVLVGVDDQSRMTPSKEAKTDVRKAMAAVTQDDFVILLKHKPIIDSDMAFDLQLSGHTHGGQIFPFALPARLINGVPTGLIQLGQGRQLYVSRGVGTWGPPIRLFSAPEIALITIESTNK
ncbi:MAG: metallophosphoesterase [Oxalobacter sp.]|nr:MAG: metallophosphoesterase [Oxalobacter sp.]